MTYTEIALIRLPGDEARLDELRRRGEPRLIFLDGDTAPPISVDEIEDWIRVPADERDIIARQEGLRRRLAEPDNTSPVIDEAGLLRYRDQWVSIPPMEVRLLGKLIDNLGGVVSREELSDATWPEGARGRNALDVHMLRLRRRVGKVGLVIQTVRAQGYLLESFSDAGIDSQAS